MWPLHRPIIQITVWLEYLALDEVWCSHRVAVVSTRIPRRNPVSGLKRRTILRDCLQFQSLETCPRRDGTLDAIFHIIRFMDNSGAAFRTIRRVGINSLSVTAIGRVKHLRSRL